MSITGVTCLFMHLYVISILLSYCPTYTKKWERERERVREFWTCRWDLFTFVWCYSNLDIAYITRHILRFECVLPAFIRMTLYVCFTVKLWAQCWFLTVDYRQVFSQWFVKLRLLNLIHVSEIKRLTTGSLLLKATWKRIDLQCVEKAIILGWFITRCFNAE